MSTPADHLERTRFAEELDRNFSVVASAGAGKTHAITERIIAMAGSARAMEWLPQLVVVTFTNRAADEMQQRARQRLLEAGVALDVLAAFNRAFFGTIHSFCVKLLRAHGHMLGLPAEGEIVTDDTAIWRAFVQQQTRVGIALPDDVRTRLFRHVRVADLMALGRDPMLAGCEYAPPGEAPNLDFTAVYAASHNNRRSLAKIVAAQRALREWENLLKSGEGFVPLPKVDGGGAAFEEAWAEAFVPLREWIQHASLSVAAEMATAFCSFRRARGALTFHDQVALARELFRDPATARRIREKNYRVILDEAQDTDPDQFAVLLDVARSPDAHKESPPRSGHFCMVGDFQQSIYGRRADLIRYQGVHELVVSDGEHGRFSVTFRLDRGPLDFVNRTFPRVLDGTRGQVSFEKLEWRADAHPGQVVCVSITHNPDDDPIRAEAEQLAGWIRDAGLIKLRGERWSDVVIICPRIRWFAPLRAALQRVGLSAQLQSDNEVRGDHPAQAWFTALIVCLVQPENAWEIVGVLREVFGVSDHDLAVFAEGHADRFWLTRPVRGEGPVAATLRLLADLRTRIAGRSLLAQVRETVATTQLRERLLSLPAEEYEALDETLDELLTMTAAAEADGLTLADFAERLRVNFEAKREPRAPRPDAVQIITGHKAKGSEWPVVIVPFFARKVGSASPNYPRLYRDENAEPRVAFSADDITPETAEVLKLRERQEGQRLLYVALTRAKHTLVLVEDRAAFSFQNGVSNRAQAHLLGVESGGVNEAIFVELVGEATACEQTAASWRAREKRAAASSCLPLDPVDDTALTTAKARASIFLKRNPSALVAPPEADATKTTEPELRAGAGESAGALYGVWWHALVERLDWAATQTWDGNFARMLETSPDAERARVEWDLFRAAMRYRPEIVGVAHPEFPFLWRMNDTECLEGIIDLAVFDPQRGVCLIVDWKTNRITPEETVALHDRYAPQLAAYRAALRAILGAPVSAAIYSTTTGAWLPYDDDALEREWTELRRIPEKLEAALLA